MDKAGEKGLWNVCFTKLTVMETYGERPNLGKLNTLQGAQTAETPSILYFTWEIISFHFIFAGRHLF